MHTRLAASIWLIVVGMASTTSARSLCVTLETMSRMEVASQRFLSSSSEPAQRNALEAMSEELLALEAADLSSSAFARLRTVLIPFMQSRRQVVRQADMIGITAAIATARTAAYAGHAMAFDAVYQPLRCKSPPAGALAQSAADGSRMTQADRREISAQDGFELSASTMAYTAIIVLILGAAGLRGLHELRSRRKRRSKRFHCAIDTGIRKDGWRFDARLHDISRVGCKLQSKAKLAVGDDIEVTLLGAEQQGRVVWANRHYIGVEFLKRLSESQIELAITAKPDTPIPKVLGQI